jgi:hypothetical protein
VFELETSTEAQSTLELHSFTKQVPSVVIFLHIDAATPLLVFVLNLAFPDSVTQPGPLLSSSKVSTNVRFNSFAAIMQRVASLIKSSSIQPLLDSYGARYWQVLSSSHASSSALQY